MNRTYKKWISRLTALAVYAAGIPATLHLSHADESISDKAADAGTDLQKNTSKMVRKGKRHMRKATGNDNAVKDSRDKLNDMGDDLSAGAKKTRRKIKSGL